MNEKFPSIYRRITENLKNFKKRNSMVLKSLKFQGSVFLFITTIGLILFLSLDLLISLQRQKEINLERTKIQGEIKLWEQIAEKYPGYKETYFQLTKLEYQIREYDKAKYYVDKALYIDPNFEKAIELKKTLRNY